MTAPTLSMLGPELTLTTWLVGALTMIVLAVVTILCVVRARRLDRLHRRTDAARAGLADALEHRGSVALRVADTLAEGPTAPSAPLVPGTARPAGATPVQPPGSATARRGSLALRAASEALALRTAAREALTACRTGARPAGAGFELCEAAENTLTARLAKVDRAVLPSALGGELVDAEQLVVLARRVHNDAVRDTLDLRSRRLVRWLRLAGTAPVPAYFEIADPPRRDALPAPSPNAGEAEPGAVATGTAAG